MEEAFISTNRISLHVVQAGQKDAPLVLLLHGFPEFWYGWRHQIEPLAASGYRIWAPDQRGYNLSAKPKGIGAYRLDLLAADIVGLINAAGTEKAIVVGHDWGAAVAWYLAARYPERLQQLVIVNVPHPSVMLKTVATNPKQMLKSWYVAFFQLPWIPEFSARWRNWQLLVQALKMSSRPGAFTDEDFKHYREAWSQPGAMRSMLNWYRAIVQKPAPTLEDPRIHVPTLMIWGVHDVALSREMARPSIERCDRGRLVFLEDATHWVQHEEPERVNELILEALK